MKRNLFLKRIFQATIFLIACILLFLLSTKHAQTYQGYVEGENLYLVAPYSGKLVEKNVSRGEKVKKGQVLFRIDPNPEEMYINELKASVKEMTFSLIDLKKPRRKLEIDAFKDQVDEINANLELANMRVKRYSELYKKQAVDLDHVDEAKTLQQQLLASKAQGVANYELSKLGARIDQIKAQEAREESAKLSLMIGQWKARQKIIEAPTDGVIFDTYFQQGEYVSAEKPLASLLPNNRIRIEFFVPARELASLALNQAVYFNCEGCAETNEASIQYISPEAEYIPPLVYSRENSDKIVFRIKADIKNPQLFKPGQPVIITGFAHAK